MLIVCKIAKRIDLGNERLRGDLRCFQQSHALLEQAIALFLVVDDAGHFQHDWKVAEHMEQHSVAV